jgi:histidinol dehydrogenase
MKDSIVESVIEKIKSRSDLGIKKYNKTLDRTDMSTIEWLDAAIEEQMDNILYLTRLKKNLIENGIS